MSWLTITAVFFFFLKFQCVISVLIYDVYIGNILPMNALIKAYNHSSIKVIWFSDT